MVSIKIACFTDLNLLQSGKLTKKYLQQTDLHRMVGIKYF